MTRMKKQEGGGVRGKLTESGERKRERSDRLPSIFAWRPKSHLLQRFAADSFGALVGGKRFCGSLSVERVRSSVAFQFYLRCF